jgi:hypothetical protein
MVEKRCIVTNTTAGMMLVFTEPEAQDYWLRPGESVELRSLADSPADDFEVKVNRNGVTVWPSNGLGYVSMWADGAELSCGHQRPPGWPEVREG